MKAEQFNLINEKVRQNAIDFIMTCNLDGKTKVTIGNIGSKTSNQQRLDWKWDGEINKSGVGWHDDTVEITHARSKWMFARPILLREDDIFPIIYNSFMNTVKSYDPEEFKKARLKFADRYISTQNMSMSQAAEYMTNKQLFWINKGVYLTDPKQYGLDIR